MPGIGTVTILTNTAHARARSRAASTSWWSAAATSASSSRRCTGGSAPQVTVVEMGPRLIAARGRGRLAGDPRDPRGGGHRRAHQRECIGLAPHAEGVAVGVDCTGGDPDGRRAATSCSPSAARPNTDDLGLDRAGVATDARGYIPVDDELRTNVPGIWALGDCNGRGAFTHTAYNDYEIVAANLLDGERRR